MLKSNIFYDKIEKRYKKRKLQYQPEELTKLIDILYQQAKKNYSKLSKPKFCSLKAYISVWINEEIGKDIAKKSFTSIDSKNPPNDFKASVKFYLDYPQSKIFRTEENGKVDDNIDLTRMKKKWLKMIKERSKFSINKGYKSRLDMVLKDFKIPQSEYNKFSKNVNKAIRFYRHQIYLNLPKIPNQKLNNFCFICNFKSSPFKNLSDFLKIFKEKEYFFKKNENRIKIQFGNHSKIDYVKETDGFTITLKEKTNINHQIVDLIHELAHVTSMIKILKQNKFIKLKAYYLEKSAIKKEIIFLKKYFPEILIAKLGDILRIICQTLFEIEIYQNPNKDPDKLYLKYLNKCFKKNKRTNSRDYLSNQDILYKSFSQLIYTTAYVNTLQKERWNVLNKLINKNL